MSQSSNGSKRSRRQPPPRLGWPSSTFAATTRDDDAKIGNTKPKQPTMKNNKRPRRVTFGATRSQSNDNSDLPHQMLWIDLYAPQSSNELVVAPKKVKEVMSWLSGKGDYGNSKMLILVGSPGIGKSTMIHCLARELEMRVEEWTESYFGSDCSSFRNGENFSTTIDHPTPLNSIQHFLEQTSSGFASLLATCNGSSSGHIILLDELPNLHGPDAEKRFRDMFTHHVHTTSVKTVLIFSDTVEGEARPEVLEKLLHPDTLYSPQLCCIVQINPPTKPRFANVVKLIMSREKRSYWEDPDNLYARCNGDVRFAITTLQYEMSKTQIISQRIEPSKRDTKLTSFHALGKLLYAKRQVNNACNTNCDKNEEMERPRLEFDPERVVEQSEMELSGVLYFLEYHSPDFFNDNHDLSLAFGYFSDAVWMLDHAQEGYNDKASIFPAAYAAALASRTVAYTNRHPTAHKFRQFASPKVFDVIRKRRENVTRLNHLHDVNYAVNDLPFMRKVQPQQVPLLHSYFGETTLSQSRNIESNNQTEIEAAMKEQDMILQLDDIMEEDDADGDTNCSLISK